MESDIRALQTRVDALESANRKVRLAAVAIAVLSTVAVLAAQSRNSHALEAERFVLKDANGQTRGGMLVTADGPALELYDANQTVRLVVSVHRNTPNLTIKDANGTGVVVVADSPTGPGLMLFDRSGNPRAQFDVGDTGPRLYVEDAKGFSTTVGAYLTGIAAPTLAPNAASVVLASKAHGILWRAPK